METIVRDATEADLPAILQIYNQAIEHTTAVFSYKPHTPEMRLAWFREEQSKGYPVLVAESDVVVVGFATYGPFRALPAYKYSVENSVYVTERARRAEFARAMMTRLLTVAREGNVHAVIEGIVADNVASLRLHRSLGFEEVAHFREVRYKFGRWLDLKFLELVLNGPTVPDES